jgi:hypothetical protein
LSRYSEVWLWETDIDSKQQIIIKYEFFRNIHRNGSVIQEGVKESVIKLGGTPRRQEGER